MTKELELRLIEQWPAWFKVGGDLRHTLMPLGFHHHDGWFELLFQLAEDLQPLTIEAEEESGEPFEVLQVKEKFGALRFYISDHTDAIDKRIAAAEVESSRTCEMCGQRGSLHGLKTRCEQHAQER